MAHAIIMLVPVVMSGVGVGIYTGSAWLGIATSCAVYALSPYYPDNQMGGL